MSEPEERRWSIRFEHYDRDDERRRGALLALGNGLLSWRASAPEAAALLHQHDWQEAHYAGLYRSGWYDEAPREVNGTRTCMAALTNLPDPFGVSFSLDGELWFSLDQASVVSYQQELDLRGGLLYRRVELKFQEHRFLLRETRLVSMAQPHLAALRWELDCLDEPDSLYLRITLDGSVRNSLIERERYYEGTRLGRVELEQHDAGLAAASAHLHHSERRVAVAVETRVTGWTPRWRRREEQGRAIQECRLALGDNRSLVIEKRASILVDDELPEGDAAARARALESLPEDSFEQLVEAHRQAWQLIWERMPIYAGETTHELPLRLHAFHLLQTVSPNSIGHDLGCPPRSWQEGYFGQIFWDELFAFPFLATHFPELARELLDYRHKRLDTARERAARCGYRGAMYPWRSARSGEDETPPFQLFPLSGNWVADHTYLQRHIGAAIAYDVWTLYLATGDRDLLRGMGGEMILEIARFWGSIVEHDENKQRWVIRRVIGPDEYHNRYPDADHPGLDNNAYTNVMAAWTLTCALELLAELGADANPLRDRLKLDDAELAHWDDVSRTLYLPFLPCGALGQFEGFDHLATAPAEWLTQDRERLDWMLEARGDSAERYQLTKQADVLMLLYLFSPSVLHRLLERLGYPMDKASMKRTLDYHLARITHESSLSKVVCAGALSYHDAELSWQYFCETLEVDMSDQPDQGTLDGVHLGAMSGSLDVVQRHFLGIQPTMSGLGIHPCVPPQLRSMQLAFRYQGALFTAELRDGELSVQSASDNLATVRVEHGGGCTSLAPGEQLKFPARPAD